MHEPLSNARAFALLALAALPSAPACTRSVSDDARVHERPGEPVSLTAAAVERDRDAVLSNAERVTLLGLEGFSRALPFMTAEAEPEYGWREPAPGGPSDTGPTDGPPER